MTALIAKRASSYVAAALLLAAGLAGSTQLLQAQGSEPALAIVGATLIDGNGGPPVRDATIVVRGKQIVAVGPRSSVTVPAGARIIDGAGKFAMPGIIDTNVHVGPLGGTTTFARYWDRLEDIVLQASQLHLKYGVTTVRDSYGPLAALKAVRDAIARGEVIGPRMYVAGNIVGWGGPYSDTFSRTQERGLDLFQEQMNELFTMGSGEELIHMTPQELKVAINKYLDHGPDFIKYRRHVARQLSHAHWFLAPGAESDRRGNAKARAHCGDPFDDARGPLDVDHGGTRSDSAPGSRRQQRDHRRAPRPDCRKENHLLDASEQSTGKLWQDHLKEREKKAGEKKENETSENKAKPQRLIARTPAEIRRAVEDSGLKQEGTLLIPNLEMRRANFVKLFKRGAILTVGADNVVGEAPEFRRTKKSEHLEPGIGTIVAIEGMVELGMTPAQAIVAATKNGARASKALDKFGTLEAGKLADVLLLGDDPLANISNIRKLEVLLKEGQLVDLKSLPTKRAYGPWSPTTEPN